MMWTNWQGQTVTSAGIMSDPSGTMKSLAPISSIQTMTTIPGTPTASTPRTSARSLTAVARPWGGSQSASLSEIDKVNAMGQVVERDFILSRGPSTWSFTQTNPGSASVTAFPGSASVSFPVSNAGSLNAPSKSGRSSAGTPIATPALPRAVSPNVPSPRPGSSAGTSRTGDSLSLNLSSLSQTVPVYLPSNVSTQSTPRGGTYSTPRMASMATSAAEETNVSPRLKMLKDDTTSPEATTNKMDLLSTGKSTNLDSLAEVMSPTMSSMLSPNASSPDFMSPSSHTELAIPALSASWTYPVAKHSNPTLGRDGKPYWYGVRLHGDTDSRLASAARRREQLEQEYPPLALQDSPRSPVVQRTPSRCFDDLYADAVERHRRFKARVTKFLEQEDARVAEGVGRARQEFLDNQHRWSGKREPDSPSPGAFRRELRNRDFEAQKQEKKRQEADACSFRPNNVHSVKRSRSATPDRPSTPQRSHNYGTETARRSKSVGWSGPSGSLGARSVDNKVASMSMGGLNTNADGRANQDLRGLSRSMPDVMQHLPSTYRPATIGHMPATPLGPPAYGTATIGLGQPHNGIHKLYITGTDANKDGIPDILQ